MAISAGRTKCKVIILNISFTKFSHNLFQSGNGCMDLNITKGISVLSSHSIRDSRLMIQTALRAEPPNSHGSTPGRHNTVFFDR